MLDTAHGCALSAHEQPTKGMLRAMSELGPESSGQSMQAKVRGGYLAGACVPGPVPPTFTQKRPACDCGGSGTVAGDRTGRRHPHLRANKVGREEGDKESV